MKIFIIIFFIFFATGAAIAQDPHFSQYYASPLTLNPAMTGYMKNDFRFSTNYRQQWWAIGSPFVTGTFSYDTKIMQTKIEQDVFAVGVMGLYDQSLNGGFKNVNLSGSVAYHKALDADNASNLALGFQFTYASRRINSEKLTFASQFIGNGFDTNLPSNENFGSLSKNYFDLNTGLLYTYKDENAELYIGGSMYHITSPDMSFIKNEKYKLPKRYSGQIGTKLKLGESNNTLFLSGIYMNQANATERTLGAVFGLNAAEEAMVYGGVWLRVNDAWIPYVGLDYKNLQFGLSYDITTSGLKSYAPKNSSVELSINISGNRAVNVYTNYKKGRVF